MRKVLIAEKLAPAAVEILEERGFQADVRTGLTREDLLAEIPNYHGLIIRSATQADAELIDAASELEVIGRAGVGVDNVDIKAATHKGIVVCNAPTSNIVSAAEQTLALMLATARRTPQANASMHAGKWERSSFKGNELDGKTLAIFGLGRIGALVAERAAAFGMRLIGYDPYTTDERAAEIGVERLDTLEEILPQADFITVHLPKSKETIGMFSTDEYSQMKEGVYLVNAARGGIYDEAAMVPFLESGHIAGVGLDVYSKEPPVDHPFLSLSNAVMTPHLGASTVEAQERAGTQIATYVADVLDDLPVTTALNVARTDPAVRAEIEPYINAVRYAGRIIAQIFGEKPVGALYITSQGFLARTDTHILTTAALRGIFEETSEVPVNLVNADYIAEEQGVTVYEHSDEDAGDYIAKISLRALSADGTEVNVEAAVDTSTNQPRIVGLMNYKVDLNILPHFIILRYPDKPGLIGKIGTLFGKHEINISHLEVSPKPDSEKALLIMGVDQPVPQSVRTILEDEIVNEAYYLNF